MDVLVGRAKLIGPQLHGIGRTQGGGMTFTDRNANPAGMRGTFGFISYSSRRRPHLGHEAGIETAKPEDSYEDYRRK